MRPKSARCCTRMFWDGFLTCSGVGVWCGIILFWLTHLIFGLILIHIPVLGEFLNFIINVLVFWVFWGILGVGSFAFSVIGAYNAWGGNLWQMPLLWYYARRLKF